MQKHIWRQLIVVIFVLSTIVAVTDCCSSRILLLREHTLKIVQHNFHNHLHEHAHELQQQIEKRVADLVTQMELNKTLTPEILFNEAFPTPPSAVESDSSTLTPNGGKSPNNDSSLLMSSSSVHDSSTIRTPSMVTNPTPNLSKPDYNTSIPCIGQYRAEFCMNGGRCFRFPFSVNHSFFYCECPDGFFGERCDSKSLDGRTYIETSVLDSTKPKVLMARIVFSFPMLMLLSTIYILFGAFIVYRGPHATSKHQRTTGFFAS